MDRLTLKKEIGNLCLQYWIDQKEAAMNGYDVKVNDCETAISALNELWTKLGLDKEIENEGRYVYGIRIFLDECCTPMAELAFGDGGRPNGETKTIRWDIPDERDAYVINAYTFIWDERTKDIAYGTTFEEYKNYGN